MNNSENSATANSILIILLVLVVGFIVWFVAARGDGTPATTNNDADSPSLQVNLGDNDDDDAGEANNGSNR